MHEIALKYLPTPDSVSFLPSSSRPIRRYHTDTGDIFILEQSVGHGFVVSETQLHTMGGEKYEPRWSQVIPPLKELMAYQKTATIIAEAVASHLDGLRPHPLTRLPLPETTNPGFIVSAEPHRAKPIKTTATLRLARIAAASLP